MHLFVHEHTLEHLLVFVNIILHIFMNFFERLEKVLEDRTEYGWSKPLGINRGTIRNIKEGAIPGWETLSVIRRVEGVNLQWLAEGHGQPFEVLRFINDDERAESLAQHLDEEGWTVTIATDSQRCAAILSQPGEAEVHGRAGRVTTYRYTVVEIIPGLQQQSLIVIGDHGKDIRLAELSHEQIEAIFTGNAGTYRLLNEKDGWLRGARPITAQHPIFTAAAPTPRHLTHDEEHLIKLYGRMAAEHRATYKAIGTTLAQQDADKKTREAAD